MDSMATERVVQRGPSVEGMSRRIDELGDGYEGILGKSPVLQASLWQLQAVAPTQATVLLLGETGTGKEMFARAVHARSSRWRRPLVKVNCAALSPGLMESEFFGHVKGAYTGAVRDRAGRFASANGGTLFLDEVGEIPIELQSKLLRVLEVAEYERVGEDRTRTVDVRIVAATNRDLVREVEAGRFRADLYYRLNVFPIDVPPLRERVEDIPVLAQHFLDRASERFQRSARLTETNFAELRRYDWPGNVRELQNAVERALITANAEELRFELSPLEPSRGPASAVLTDAAIREIERTNLVAALELADWRIYGDGGVAQLLGLKPTTVASRVQRLGLKRHVTH